MHSASDLSFELPELGNSSGRRSGNMSKPDPCSPQCNYPSRDEASKSCGEPRSHPPFKNGDSWTFAFVVKATPGGMKIQRMEEVYEVRRCKQRQMT